MKLYDLIIIGAGPAGVSAGVYAKNFGLDFVIIGEVSGGMINTAYKVENYPGIFGLTGKELGEKFEEHLKYLKISLVKERINKIKEGMDSNLTNISNQNISTKLNVLNNQTKG